MSCLARFLKTIGFYYYTAEQQVLRLKIEEVGEYALVFNHYTKGAFLRKIEVDA